jgi:diguanylate cyclase (GGDEF)-like protein
MNKEIEKLRRRIKKLEILAMTDTTTGLKNKRQFQKDFNKLISFMKETSECGSTYLAILDVDDFKKFNDEYGHIAGDETLKNLSEELLKIFMTFEFEMDSYRWGGEEFIFIFKNISEENLEKILQKICVNRICKVSIGASKFRLHSLNMTLHLADKELYYVKNHGKDGFSIETTICTKN